MALAIARRSCPSQDGGRSAAESPRRPVLCRGAQAIAASGHARTGAARGTSVAPLRRMPESTRSLIRTLRQQLGMTQEEFAHQIAVTVSTVNRWENSHAEPSKLAWKAIRDLARMRGVPADGGSSSSAY